MELVRILKARVSDRIAFWIVFLCIAAVCFLFLRVPYVQRRDARRAYELLTPMLRSDPRFAAVRVSLSTSGAVMVSGAVSSESDMAALRTMVKQSNLAARIRFHVTTSLLDSANETMQRTGGSRSAQSVEQTSGADASRR